MSSEHQDELELLVEEVLARWRGGEDVSIREYTTRHPALAAELRELFPALVALEDHAASRSAQ